jgi:ADP-ribose pyrophosphatase YjhB (NUDIX family)
MKFGVGVGVIIMDGSKILLGLRNSDKEKADSELNGEGTWTMPGGKLEMNETLINAGIREVKEETDLDVTDIEVFCVQDDFSENAHFVTVGLIGNKYNGTVKTMEPDVITKWGWFDIDKLPKNIFLPSKGCIEKYISKKIY